VRISGLPEFSGKICQITTKRTKWALGLKIYRLATLADFFCLCLLRFQSTQRKKTPAQGQSALFIETIKCFFFRTKETSSCRRCPQRDSGAKKVQEVAEKDQSLRLFELRETFFDVE
jgi:hypothetical protein